MHWGTVVLSLEPIMEPPKRFKDGAEKFGFHKDDAIIFKIGEVKKIRSNNQLTFLLFLSLSKSFVKASTIISDALKISLD